jgi:predicted amidohydrolase YtcJ
MAEPYDDNPPENAGSRGLLTAVASQEGEVLRMCRAADEAGYGSAIHAIGDQANHLLLDLYATTIKANGPRANRRLRIEHAQHLLPGDIPRFAALEVIASMQPLHKADDARYAEQAIGAERCRTSYAFRSLLDAGTRVAFGSDWPVVTINPFPALHSAVTGQSLDGRIFVPEQNIGIEEALRCYTRGGACASGEEARLGRIAPGCLADFVILNEDPLRIDATALGGVTVRETYVAGRCVWNARRPAAPARE